MSKKEKDSKKKDEKLEKDIDFKIEGEKRHILEIRKVKETPNKYPRKAGIPNKKPLI